VLQNLAASYDDFEKLRLHVTTPLQLSTLPGAEMELDWGEFCGGWLSYHNSSCIFFSFQKMVGYANLFYDVAKSHLIIVH
jgi:hypothetical protein